MSTELPLLPPSASLSSPSPSLSSLPAVAGRKDGPADAPVGRSARLPVPRAAPCRPVSSPRHEQQPPGEEPPSLPTSPDEDTVGPSVQIRPTPSPNICASSRLELLSCLLFFFFFLLHSQVKDTLHLTPAAGTGR